MEDLNQGNTYLNFNLKWAVWRFCGGCMVRLECNWGQQSQVQEG